MAVSPPGKALRRTLFRNFPLTRSWRRCPLDVVDHPAALCHHFRHGGEVGVQQHQLGHLTGGVGAGGHGHAAVRILQGQHIVDAIAGHGHGVSLTLQGLDDLPLLLRYHPAKHGVLPDGPGDLLVCFQLPGVDPLPGAVDAGLLRHGRDRHRMVARDHFHMDALAVEIVKDLGGAAADGVFQHQQGHGEQQAVELALLRAVALGQQQHPAALLCKEAGPAL